MLSMQMLKFISEAPAQNYNKLDAYCQCVHLPTIHDHFADPDLSAHRDMLRQSSMGKPRRRPVLTSTAWAYYQRAVAIQEEQLGIHHPDTARTLNNLAAWYRDRHVVSEVHQRSFPLSASLAMRVVCVGM